MVHQVGPFPWFRILAQSLRAGPRDEEVGQYRGGVWHMDGGNGTRLAFLGPTCSLRFEDGTDHSDGYGPFDSIEFIDGAIYTHPGHVLLARLDESHGRWYAYGVGRWWTGLVIEG